MMERLSRRNEGMAAEYARFSSALSGLTESSQETYAVDTNDVPLLNEGMNATARHLDSSRQLLEDEARGWEEGVLEDLKRQRDTLVSVRDMFDRRDKYARDKIPQLEKRIANNETKLQNIRQKTPEQIKPGEAEKVEDAIFKVSHYHSFPPHVFFLTMTCRTRNLLFNNMRVVSSLRNASAMNLPFSKRANIMLVGCIRSGRRRGSNTRSCKRTIGGH